MHSENSMGVMERKTAGERSPAIRVWLVDDSENFRILLASLLEDEGGLKCERQFSSAEGVLQALSAEAPDVILLDNRMPGMGGAAAVRPIRERAPGTRVLMLTTFGDQEARRQVLRDGASDFLLKSFHIDEIADRVRDAMTKPLVVPGQGSVESFAARAAEDQKLGEAGTTVLVQRKTVARSSRANYWVRNIHRLRGWWNQMLGRDAMRSAGGELVPGTPS